MKELHRVKRRNSWNIKISIGKGSAVAHNETVGRECAKLICVFIGVPQVALISRILQEPNSKRIETHVLRCKRHQVGFLFELEGKLNVRLLFLFYHIVCKSYI